MPRPYSPSTFLPFSRIPGKPQKYPRISKGYNHDKEAIHSTLEDFAEAYCVKDIDSLMRVFDNNDNISVIGTGADELCVGRAAVKELFLRIFGEATANRFE